MSNEMERKLVKPKELSLNEKCIRHLKSIGIAAYEYMDEVYVWLNDDTALMISYPEVDFRASMDDWDQLQDDKLPPPERGL